MSQIHSQGQSRWVMLVNESARRGAESEELLRAAGFGVELINQVDSMVMHASRRYYDAIVVDLEGTGDAMTAVLETRRLESARGLRPTAILGVGEVDGLARTLAIQAGFSDVLSPDRLDDLIDRLRNPTSEAVSAA